MNLLLFRIDVERDPAIIDRSHRERASDERTTPRDALIWIALIAVIGCTALGSGLLISTGTTMTELPDWLESWAFGASTASDTRFRLDVASMPPGARVLVDGREHGRTPITVLATAGRHELVLKHADAVDEHQEIYVVGDGVVEVNLWLRRPDAVQLRAAYPGSTIRDVAFLADGRLSMSMSRAEHSCAPDGNAAVEAWVFDPTDGEFRPLSHATEYAAPFLAVSPDGRRVPFARGNGQLAPRGGPAARPLEEVWLSGVDGAPPKRVVRSQGLPKARRSTTSRGRLTACGC